MAFENAHHSTETREMMHAFYVGQYVDVSLIVKVYVMVEIFYHVFVIVFTLHFFLLQSKCRFLFFSNVLNRNNT